MVYDLYFAVGCPSERIVKTLKTKPANSKMIKTVWKMNKKKITIKYRCCMWTKPYGLHWCKTKPTY